MHANFTGGVNPLEPAPAFLGDATAVGGRYRSQAISTMTRLPTLAAINAAELRVVQSKRNVRLSVDRTRSALRAAIARPSTLLLVAVASGIWAFLLSRRVRLSVKSQPSNADSKSRASIPSLLRTFVSMYGARLLAFALQLGAAAWQRSGSRINANMPSTLATDDTATTGHDSAGPGQQDSG